MILMKKAHEFAGTVSVQFILYFIQAILFLDLRLFLCDSYTNESYKNASYPNYDYDNFLNNYTSEATFNQSLELLNNSLYNVSDIIEDNNFTEVNPVVIENWENPEVSASNRKYLSFTTPDEDICSCDLYLNVCDINCCCDSDCSEEDIKVFSECHSQALTPDKNYCYQNVIIFKNNTVYKMEKDPESSLFCIVHDNLKQHLRFKDMPVIKSHRDLALLLKYQSKNIYSWDSQQAEEMIEWSEIRTGNPIYIDSISSQLRKSSKNHWTLPSSCYTRVCSCSEEVRYLEDFNSSCSRVISSLKSECQSYRVLSADYYSNFCISSRSLSPDISTNLNDLITHTKNMNFMQENYTQICSEKNTIQPKYIENSCINAVKGVHFTVIHNGFKGIYNVTTNFEYVNISEEKIIFLQHFTVKFKWHNVTDAVKKSGNPGYQVGFPILAGTNNSILEMEDLFSIKIKPNGLSVLDKDLDSMCGKTRKTIKFGKNLKTSCIFKNDELDCKLLQDRIFDILLDVSKTQVFVGVFGNANESNVDDWIEAYHEDHEISNPNGACSLIISLKINIAYAAVGTVVNPQFKILGVGYHYSKPIAIDSTESLDLLLSTSVSFFDATEPAIAHYPKVPSIKANLPSDFFYPFLYDKQAHFFPNVCLILCMSLFLLSNSFLFVTHKI